MIKIVFMKWMESCPRPIHNLIIALYIVLAR